MPFLKATLQTEGEQPKLESIFKPFPSQPDQVPVFLIPSILGNSAEYSQLIQELSSLGENRDIFVWVDPLITEEASNRPVLTDEAGLFSQAKLISKAILEDCLPSGPAPYLVIGYSYGCGLAALVGQQLMQQESDVRLFLIDGPTPECSKSYFSNPSLSLANDLISIMKYAVTLSLKRKSDIQQFSYLNENLAQGLFERGLAPNEIIQTTMKTVLENESLLFQPLFHNHIKVILQNLNNIMTTPENILTAKFDHIVTLTTNETANKYNKENTSHIGWEKHTDHLQFIPNTELQDQAHSNLLKEQELATSVKYFIRQEATKKQLIDKQMQAIFAALNPKHSGKRTRTSSSQSPRIEPFSNSNSESDNEEALDLDYLLRLINEEKKYRSSLQDSCSSKSLRSSGLFGRNTAKNPIEPTKSVNFDFDPSDTHDNRAAQKCAS